MADIRFVQGDITEQEADAIVNAANHSLLGGGGVDGAIHRRGGPEILAECRRLRETRFPDGLPTGEAVATTAGRLPARWVIHTVGPTYAKTKDKSDLLAACFRNSLAVADELGAATVAFPAISTGVYRWPVDDAARIAVQTVRGHLHRGARGHLRTVRPGGLRRVRGPRVGPGNRPIAWALRPPHPGDVRTVLNIIWFVFSGIWLWIAYMLAGVLCCLLIITIPWGIASFRMASYAVWPFGREVVHKPSAGVFSFLGNVIWVIAAGWWLALTHIATGLLLCITIIGIPMGIANFKLIPISLMPLGKEIVSKP